MAESRIVHLLGSLPGRLAITTQLENWRRLLMEGGVPVAVDPEPPVDADAAAFHAVLLELEEGLRVFREAELARDELRHPHPWTAGEVNAKVWVPMVVGSAAVVQLTDLLTGIVVSAGAFGVTSAAGLTWWWTAEHRRKRALARAERDLAEVRAGLVAVVRRLYARPLDLVMGETRYVVTEGEAEIGSAAT